MKKILIAVIILTATIIAGFALKGPLNIETLPIGSKAPMPDHPLSYPDSERSETLQSLNQENGLLVVFSCNTCPFVVAWEDRYNGLHELAKSNKVGMVLVNSNEAKRAGDDAPDAMIAHARKLGYTMPYLIDENHKLADAFGAKTTPHVFLFNKNMELVYEGAIDDNYKSADDVKETFCADAIKEMAAGKKVSTPTSPAKGCSIKRVKA